VPLRKSERSARFTYAELRAVMTKKNRAARSITHGYHRYRQDSRPRFPRHDSIKGDTAPLTKDVSYITGENTTAGRPDTQLYAACPGDAMDTRGVCWRSRCRDFACCATEESGQCRSRRRHSVFRSRDDIFAPCRRASDTTDIFSPAGCFGHWRVLP
jgi:hypothetical protein